MEVTIPFLFQMLVVLYIFFFIGIALILLYFMKETKILQEAIAAVIASDPKMTKRILTMIESEKEKIKTKMEEEDGNVREKEGIISD